MIMGYNMFSGQDERIIKASISIELAQSFLLIQILEKSNFRLPVYKEYSLWDIKDALHAFKDRVNGRIVFNL